MLRPTPLGVVRGVAARLSTSGFLVAAASSEIRRLVGRWAARRASADLSIFPAWRWRAATFSGWPCLAAGNPHPRHPDLWRARIGALRFFRPGLSAFIPRFGRPVL